MRLGPRAPDRLHPGSEHASPERRDRDTRLLAFCPFSAPYTWHLACTWRAAPVDHRGQSRPTPGHGRARAVCCARWLTRLSTIPPPTPSGPRTACAKPSSPAASSPASAWSRPRSRASSASGARPCAPRWPASSTRAWSSTSATAAPACASSTRARRWRSSRFAPCSRGSPPATPRPRRRRATSRTSGAILAEMRRRLDAGDLLGASDHNALLHGRILEISGHATVARLIATLKYQLVRFQYRTILLPGRSEHSFGEHSAIVQAIRAGDPTPRNAPCAPTCRTWPRRSEEKRRERAGHGAPALGARPRAPARRLRHPHAHLARRGRAQDRRHLPGPQVRRARHGRVRAQVPLRVDRRTRERGPRRGAGHQRPRRDLAQSRGRWDQPAGGGDRRARGRAHRVAADRRLGQRVARARGGGREQVEGPGLGQAPARAARAGDRASARPGGRRRRHRPPRASTRCWA